MKRVCIISFCCIAVFLLTACGSSSSKNEEEEEKITVTGADGKEYTSYQEACKDGDFETAHSFLNAYHEKYVEAQSRGSMGAWRYERNKYFQAFDYIYKREIQYLLSELDEEECKDKILFILEEIPAEGEKFPEGLCDYRIVCRGDFGDDGIPLDAYIVWTQHYNRLCNNILTLAINRKNRSLAQSILLQYVDNVEAIKGDSDGSLKVNGVKVDGNHGYIKYTSEDRDAAKKKYDEAVKSGAFD